MASSVRPRTHRRSLRPLVAAAALLPVGAAGFGVAAGAAPPDDPEAAAVERFIAIAESRGYTVADPICQVRTQGSSEYLCFGQVGDDPGDLFVISTDVGGDVIDYRVVAEPSSSSDNGPPQGASLPAFDPLHYFGTLFSADPEAVDELLALTAPGSPAEAYLGFQREASETAAELGLELPPASVFVGPDTVRMCPDAESPCAEFTDIVVSNGLLESFEVDGNQIAPRLGIVGEAITVGGVTLSVASSYRTVTSGSLQVYLELSATDAAGLDLATATYLGPDGSQTGVSVDESIGAIELLANKEPLTLMLAFPRSLPGGTLRFDIYPADGSTPLAAHVQVPALVPALPGDPIPAESAPAEPADPTDSVPGETTATETSAPAVDTTAP